MTGKTRRWRDGDCLRCVLVLSIMMGTASAACPPTEADGSVIRKDGLLLAYQPLGKTGRIPMAKHFALEVQLCDKNGISAARLQKVDATMPEHRHGMNYRPVVAPLGGGRFRVEGMMFHMAGRWELAFEVQSGKETTRFTHDMQIE